MHPLWKNGITLVVAELIRSGFGGELQLNDHRPARPCDAAFNQLRCGRSVERKLSGFVWQLLDTQGVCHHTTELQLFVWNLLGLAESICISSTKHLSPESNLDSIVDFLVSH